MTENLTSDLELTEAKAFVFDQLVALMDLKALNPNLTVTLESCHVRLTLAENEGSFRRALYSKVSFLQLLVCKEPTLLMSTFNQLEKSMRELEKGENNG